MRSAVLVLSCLACAVHARRVHDDKKLSEDDIGSVQALSMMLLAQNPSLLQNPSRQAMFNRKNTRTSLAPVNMEVKDLAQELHVIFVRHGRTTDNAQGVISGGDANPDLVPEGKEQAKAANVVYKALEAKGLVNDDTVVFTTDRSRAQDTAKFFTGRTNAENIVTDQRLMERLLGTWDSKLTERLQKEVKKIDGFTPPFEEKPADHKAHVEECLDERIKASNGTPFIIVSHGGTTRRIAAYLGIEEGLEVQNAVPHHAVSRDGGKSWEIKKFAVDASGELSETVLPKQLPKPASTERTMQSILEEHASNTSISNGVLTILADLSSEAKAALADDLGQLLIGKLYKDEGVVSIDGSRIMVTLDDIQAEIITTFAKLKGMEIASR